MSDGRVRWIDIAKGFAILSILIQHIQVKDSTGAFVFTPYVAQFNVSLFFLIAGFFVTTKRALPAFVHMKAKRLLVPYIITCMVIGLFLIACKLARGFTSPPTIYASIKEFLASCVWGAGTDFKTLPSGVSYIGAIWYLEALFIALVETRILLRAFDHRPIVGLSIAAFLAFLASKTIPLYYIPCNLQPGLAGGLFTYIGNLYRRYFGLDHKSKPEFILVFCFIFLLSGKMLTPYSGVSAGFGNNAILTITSSLCACWLIINISIRLDKTTVAPFLSYFGTNSLLVLCTHLVLLNCGYRRLVEKCITYLPFAVPSNVITIANLLSQLLICALTIALAKRSRITHTIFY